MVTATDHRQRRAPAIKRTELMNLLKTVSRIALLAISIPALSGCLSNDPVAEHPGDLNYPRDRCLIDFGSPQNPHPVYDPACKIRGGN